LPCTFVTTGRNSPRRRSSEVVDQRGSGEGGAGQTTGLRPEGAAEGDSPAAALMDLTLFHVGGDADAG